MIPFLSLLSQISKQLIINNGKDFVEDEVINVENTIVIKALVLKILDRNKLLTYCKKL